MSEFSGLYDIRDFKESDKNFVLATFLRGVYYGDSWFSSINKKIFMDNYKHIANLLISNDRSVIKIACLPEDLDVIIGYSILTPNYQSIIWVYVKEKWRMKGIGRSLVPSQPVYVTHLSKLGQQLLPKLGGAMFNPFVS
jgi:hypothetical protein